jgi:hypothetical protein
MNRSVDFSVEGFDACFFGKTDEFGHRTCVKLLHDAAAVDFDGFLGNVKL